MLAMIDAMVLIYSIAETKEDTPQELRALYAASAALVASLDTIRISAVAWYEVRRNRSKPHEEERIRALRPRLYIEPLMHEASELAAELLLRRNKPEKVCKRCFSSEDEQPCATCRRRTSKQQRQSDALIVATAATARDPRVQVLYSFDTGVHSFAEFLPDGGLAIRRPEHADGPLFNKELPR